MRTKYVTDHNIQKKRNNIFSKLNDGEFQENHYLQKAVIYLKRLL